MKSVKTEDDSRVQGQDKFITVSSRDTERIQLYYEYTKDYFRKGEHYNLVSHAFNRVCGIKKSGNSVLLDVEINKIFNTQVDSDGELRPVIDKEKSETYKGEIRIDVFKNGIFRVLASRTGEVPEHNTVMTEGVDLVVPALIKVKETEDVIEIITEECYAVIIKEPFNISLYDKDDKCVYTQANDDKVLYFTHESFPFGFVENTEQGKIAGVISSRLEHNENFYGFGEQYSPTNKKMQEVDVFITDPLSVGSPRTYLSLPFYWSTKGYGMYVNTHYRTKFFMGNRSNRSVSCHIYENDIIDVFLIYGNQPKDILSSYTDITGKSPSVPKWSYGLWMSRCSYKTEEEVLSIAQQVRDYDIPCDVINIDTDWFEIPWACDWKFGKHNFPNPEEMMQKLTDAGIKVCLWQKPYITCEHLPELTEFTNAKGWLPKNKFGEISRANPVIDLSNPECYDWYKQKLKDLFDLGVKVIKTDMGEGTPPEGSYYGYDGEEIRNIYTYLNSKAAYEATIEHQGEGLLWGRSSYAGGQKYPIHWAGDPFSDFDGLRFTLRSGLSMGMSGFTYWSHDIGGFIGRPTNEVYVRWAQAGFFCSHSRCHGVGNPREPWTFGAKVLNIFRKYDKLRYSLIEYVNSSCEEYSKIGLPMMMHLAIANPNDRNCYDIDDQWMFGDAFLVSPVLTYEDGRDMYLPKGEWHNYWNNEKVIGGRFVYEHAKLDKLPLYVKAGSIVIYNEVKDYIHDEDVRELKVDLYYKESGETQFNYYHSDGSKHEIKCIYGTDKVELLLPRLDIDFTAELIKEGKKIEEYEKHGNVITFSI